jgi:hypothetical protein
VVLNDFAARKKKNNEIREYIVNRFILYSKHWNDYSEPNALQWNRVKFDEAFAKLVPNDQRGVYTFVAEPGIASHPCCSYLLYVGMVETSDFRTRFHSYLREPHKRKPREHVLYMIERWKSHLWFYYSPLPSSVPPAEVEDRLLTAFLPPVNRDWPAEIRDVMKLVFS